jgi:hypothetical protein
MCPRLRHLLMTSTALLALGTMPSGAQPTGGNVVGGTATISGAGTNSVIVNQSSDRAIINWNTFNIGTGGSATFNQPGASHVNRVTEDSALGDRRHPHRQRVCVVINRDGAAGRNAVITTAGFSPRPTTSQRRLHGRPDGFNIRGRSDASIVTRHHHRVEPRLRRWSPGCSQQRHHQRATRHRVARLRQQLHPRHVWRQADPARGRRPDR